ncbi:hypothetical protein J2S34_002296 [Nitrobacter winogradskyi]|uniref:Uncharacterized protein n=1 Tax=Nitrobacter winogradskyi TaxID=913 RepID=A0ACC6AK23_NITWI|nr:hypothetical protein [Nitrobacter winogradskyi]
MYERAMLERHLAQAEGHVALGERHITRQTEIVVELERDGMKRSLSRPVPCSRPL